MSKPTQIGTVFGMTALFTVLPLLLTMLLNNYAPDTPAWLLGVVWVGLLGGGAWTFAAWFGD